LLKRLVLVFVLVLSLCPLAFAKDYDGIWFLGFNFNKSFCSDINFRRAVSHAVPLNFITTKIMSKEVIPGSIVPPGMPGYDGNLKPQTSNFKLAKRLLKKVKVPKKVVLLHSNGVKTIKVAQKIRKDLADIGIIIALKEIDYANQDKWEKALASGQYHLFLMGDKAKDGDLLSRLFSSSGEANFCNFRSKKFENLLKEKKYIEANNFLYKNTVIIPLFYITKL